MAEKNNLTYDAWREYLKTDKDMNRRWKSLTSLWENVSEDLKNALEKLPKAEATKRRKALTAKNIFNVISTAKQRPNFRWQRKLIYNEQDDRHEYVIQCLDPSSDWIFRKIKEEKWVTNMHGESINKYLQPVTNKIWALKAALRVSVETESKPSDLSYEAIKMKLDDEHEVDPDYPKAPEWWRDPVQPWTESLGYVEEVEDANNTWDEKIEEKEKEPESEGDNSSNPPKLDKDGQYLIDFPEFDD